MAYYMRSNDAHDDSRYLMHGAGSALSNAWGNFKGSWSKPVQYIDKRFFNGRMHYLYPEMLEKARHAGQTVKDTTKKTAANVANTYNKAKKSVQDFRNYSKNVNERSNRAEEDVLRRESRIDNIMKSFDKNDAAFEKATTNAELEALGRREDELRDILAKNADALDKAYETMNDANAEKDTFKYKASRFLDNILNGNVSGATKVGGDWLKEQLDSGSKWLGGIGEKANTTLNTIRDKKDSVAAIGADFIQNAFNRNIQENVILPESSGRKYSGTSQKAEKRGEGVNVTQADVDRAWQKVQQARIDAGWKQGSNGAYGPSTPEVQAAMEEYLKLKERQNGPVGNSSGYSGRPGK